MTALWRHGAPRVVVLGAAIGLVLGATGAFGSGGAPQGPRIGFFMLGGVISCLIGYGVHTALERVPALAKRTWVRMIVLGAVLTAISTALSFGAEPALTDHPVSLADLPGYLLISAVMSFSITLLAYLLFREAPAPAASGPTAVKFLERLPLKLHGADLWAVEAEDHYLRLHTSRGQDLILLRLADAVAELDGLEGAQAHRSWWVARNAVVDVKRGDGRATLTLKDGSQVPVSRTHAARLRELGWF